MPGAVRIGDPNSAGGIAIGAGASSVIINGRPACLLGTSVTPHPCCGAPGCAIHCAASAAYPGSSVVTINGIRALRTGDIDTCGHPRATGSLNVTLK